MKKRFLFVACGLALALCSNALAAPGIEILARQTHGFNIRVEIKIYNKQLGIEQKKVELILEGQAAADTNQNSYYYMSRNLRPIAHWAGASWEFPMPRLDALDKSYAVKVDGAQIATVKPNIDNRVPNWLDARIQEIKVEFSPAVFTGTTLPTAKVPDEGLVKMLLGPYTLSDITYCDNDGNIVTRADKPGRYGGIVSLKAESGKVIKSYQTLYKLPPGFTPRGSPAEVSQIQAALAAGTMTHATAELIAAAEERADGVDMFLVTDNPKIRGDRWWMKTRGRALGETLPSFYLYKPHLPPDYDADKKKLWPLLIYLHGGGLGDANVYAQKGYLGFMLQGAGAEKFVKVAPYCYNGDWDKNHLEQFTDTVECQFRVDHNKIFIIGHSAGGAAVVNFSTACGRRFAGVAICAAPGKSILPGEASNFKSWNTAVWVFCGEQDTSPLGRADNSFSCLMNAGANARYSRLPGWGHGCDHFALRGSCPEFYKWMLTLDKSKPAVHPDDNETGQYVLKDASGVLEGPKSGEPWRSGMGGGQAGVGYKWIEVYHKLQPDSAVVTRTTSTVPQPRVQVSAQPAPAPAPIEPVAIQPQAFKPVVAPVPAPAPAPAAKSDFAPYTEPAAAAAPAPVPAANSNDGFRKWTGKTGKTFDGKFLEVNADKKAIFLLRDGKKGTAPVSALSDEDQAVIRKTLGF